MLEEYVYDGRLTDLFSMGVLVFIIVQGKFPHGTKILKDKYYDMIRNKRYDAYFKAVDGQGLSTAFKDLIVRLLAYDVTERPSIDQIRASPFMKDKSYNEERTRSMLMNETQKVMQAKRAGH